MGADDPGVGPIEPQPGEGHLHRTDRRRHVALLAAESPNHVLRQAAKPRIAADQHRHASPCFALGRDAFQDRIDIGAKRELFGRAVGKQIEQARAAGNEIGMGDGLARGLGDVADRARPAADNRDFGQIQRHGERSPSVPRHSPAMLTRKTATSTAFFMPRSA